MRITNIPCGEKVSEDFEIRLNGVAAKANYARVSAMPFNCIWPGHQRDLSQTEDASFISFEMDGPVKVELTARKDFGEVIVRPLSDGVKPEISSRSIVFTIVKPGQYTVELDGMHGALHIFANPELDFGVSPSDENVIYFPAGVHHPGLITLKSNQTLYIDRDAVVYGSVMAVNAENIRIVGYGVLDGSWDIRTGETVLVPSDVNRRNPQWDIYSPILKTLPIADIKLPAEGSVLLQDETEFVRFLEHWKCLSACIHLFHCKNTEINGIVFRDSSGFTIIEANCVNAVCDNVKLVGMWRYNSDGIDVFNSRNCVIKNSFFRDFDDCIVLKGIPGWDTWNMENILVENCVIWCDWGRSLEIGAETCAPEYRNIIFRDCDCIHNSAVALSIHSCDWAHVHDIVYDDIRVEYSKYDMQSVYQQSDDMQFTEKHNVPNLIYAGYDGEFYYSAERQKGKISDVTYRNIQVLTDDESVFPPAVFCGYSAEHNISDVRASGITLNGKPVTDSSVFSPNEFTENITLK